MSLGDRYNKGKVRWGLVDQRSFEPMVRVLEFGATKYSAHNWKKGLSWIEICESMLRHIYAFMDGEDLDSDSNLEHIGHIQCNAMFLSYMFRMRKDLDDRYKNKCCGGFDEKGRCNCTTKTKTLNEAMDMIETVPDDMVLGNEIRKTLTKESPAINIPSKKPYVRLDENKKKALKKELLPNNSSFFFLWIVYK